MPREVCIPRAVDTHTTVIFSLGLEVTSWKIHPKSVYFNTPILQQCIMCLPVARSRMRDLQDLACRLKERGQHLASCLCGMETGGQTISYNPKRPRRGLLPFFPNCYQSQNERLGVSFRTRQLADSKFLAPKGPQPHLSGLLEWKEKG